MRTQNRIAAAALALAATLTATSTLTPGSHADAHATKTPRIVGIYLADSDTDGNPLEVPVTSLSHVGHCHGKGYDRECRAKLLGYNKPVYVAGVDFPRAK